MIPEYPMADGSVLIVPYVARYDRTTRQALAKDYGEKYRGYIWRQRARAALPAAGYVLAPPLLALLLGAAILWVTGASRPRA